MWFLESTLATGVQSSDKWLGASPCSALYVRRQSLNLNLELDRERLGGDALAVRSRSAYLDR